MGFRNPFRMSVDKATGIVYLGDYGPDAGATNANRGPSGQVEFNRITSPGQLRLAVLHRHEHHRPRPTTSATSPSGAGRRRSTTAPAARRTTRSATPARPRCRPPGRPGSGTPATPAPRRSSAAARSRRWAARSTATTRAEPVDHRSSRSRWTGTSSPASSAAAGSSRSHVNADGSRGEISSLPVDRQAGHGHGLRPGRRAYVLDYGTGYFNGDANSALYRYRLHRRRQPGPDRGGHRQPDLRPGPADRHLLLGRLAPTPRAAR